MKHTRLLIGILVALALTALLAGTATAEAVRVSLPLNPNPVEVRTLVKPAGSTGRGLLRAREASSLEVSLEKTSGSYFTEDTVWTATATGGDGDYEYLFQLVDGSGEDANIGSEDLIANQGFSADNTFTFRLAASGSYELRVWVEDGNNVEGFDYISFDAQASGYPTVEQRVNGIVADCLASGCQSDFDKALWLHDWLTANASYDNTYSYYSAEGVLLRGTGVCESYSKAYQKLMLAAGLDCLYVTGKGTSDGETENHAWNVAKLDGQWYNIDVTWDDPNRSASDPAPVSGNEWHFYFALPDGIFGCDHSGNSGVICNAYDDNYFIRTGRVSIWTDELELCVYDALEEQGFRFDVELPLWYALEDGDNYSMGNEYIVYSLACYALNHMPGWQIGDQLLQLDINYSISENAMWGEIDFDGEPVLVLPPELKAVDEEAFMGDAAIVVAELPEGVETVGANAFADCPGLWKVIVPGSVTAIDPTAFSGSDHVTLICASDSAARSFADQNGVRWTID